MDKILLSQCAKKLLFILEKYEANDDEVALLKSSLNELLLLASSNGVDMPLEWNAVPGAYLFNEGSLRQYKDLEDAYANFKIEITGGETPTLKRLKERMAQK